MIKKTWICILALFLMFQPLEAVHAQENAEGNVEEIVFPGWGTDSEDEDSKDDGSTKNPDGGVEAPDSGSNGGGESLIPDIIDTEDGDKGESKDGIKDEKEENPDVQDAIDEDKNAGLMKWLIPVAIAFVLVFITTIVFIIRRRKVSYASSYPIPQEETGQGVDINVYVEVRIGNVRTKTMPLTMKKGELLIGSDRNASIVCNEMGVEKIHAKLVCRNQEIYLVDMSTYAGTYLEGMRIQGQNKVLSGDVVSVGNTEFVLKFS